MTKTINRRRMLKHSAIIAASMHWGAFRRTRAASASDKLNIASVGVGGKGWSDMLETSQGQNVVAICDVDTKLLGKAAAKFPNARCYSDWRNLLEQKDIDAVTVSTPDHMHAPIAMSAMQLGKHVYVQKPLSHSIYETRQMTMAAKEQGIVSQMGIQHHSLPNFKTAVKLIHDGVIGAVKEAHVWTDRPIGFWKQGMKRSDRRDTPPSHLNWELWLGVAPERPFVAELYHQFHWRAYWDFGTGALGDMGCHGMDPVVSALELAPPQQIHSQGPRPNNETGPPWSIVHYEFSGTARTSNVFRLTWYDGQRRPSGDLFGTDAYNDCKNGVLYVGEKGNLLAQYFNPPVLLPAERFADHPIEIQPADNHYLQWTEACKGNGTVTTPFDYSGPLTETVLLGNVAVRTGQTIQWDSENLNVHNVAEAHQFIRRPYRKGWDVAGLS